MEKIVLKYYKEKHRNELNKWVQKEQSLGGDGFNNFVVAKGVALGDYLSFINEEMSDMNCYVAIKNSTLIGFIVISFNRDVAHVEICGINPEFRGQGAMNEILAKLSAMLKRQGINKITLAVNNKNASGLKSFSKIAKKLEHNSKEKYTFLEI